MIKNLEALYRSLDRQATVLDVGCHGFKQVELAERLGQSGLKHSGVDYCDQENVPPGFTFRKADLSKDPLPFEDDSFDLVVAKHVIEHLDRPVVFFGECMRVCKPGGFVYFEAPSERSLLLPGMPFDYEKFYCLSFYDDPTHSIRPWSPQSFYRLSKYYSCEPIKTGYCFSWKHRLLSFITIPFFWLTRNGRWFEVCVWQAVGWACFLVAQKPKILFGKPPFNYYIPDRK